MPLTGEYWPFLRKGVLTANWVSFESYLLQVTQANPDRLVSLIATYVLGYDPELLFVQDGCQVGPIAI